MRKDRLTDNRTSMLYMEARTYLDLLGVLKQLERCPSSKRRDALKAEIAAWMDINPVPETPAESAKTQTSGEFRNDGKPVMLRAIDFLDLPDFRNP